MWQYGVTSNIIIFTFYSKIHLKHFSTLFEKSSFTPVMTFSNIKYIYTVLLTLIT